MTARIFLFTGAAAASIISAPAADDAAKPNIVVLLADDLGSSDLSSFGSVETSTPNIDQLAADGMKFTSFYAASAVCSPSRAALLTGRFPLRAGIYSWIHPSQKMHLRVEETTLAELLREAGYATAHVGKWHLGYDLAGGGGPGPDPGDHGFDHWMATGNNANPSHHQPRNFVRNGKALGKLEGYSCDIVVDEAIQWLDELRDPAKPFFLNVCFHEPHQPVAAPPEFTRSHSDTDLPAYYGSIENMDRAAGRLLDKIRALGPDTEKNTIVIFASDNGSYRDGSNGGLKGAKTILWEGGIRVPGIVRWPGVTEPGSTTDVPAGLVDILPTLCEGAGISAPTDRTIDGVSLVGLMKSGAAPERPHPLYWFYSPSRPVCVIRDGKWCLVADPTADLPQDNLFPESAIGLIKQTGLENLRLYDLEADPAQQHDVAGAEKETADRLVRTMRDLHRSVVDEAHDWRQPAE